MPSEAPKHCKIQRRRDAPKMATWEAPCAQNEPGRSTMRPPEALLPRNPTWESPHFSGLTTKFCKKNKIFSPRRSAGVATVRTASSGYFRKPYSMNFLGELIIVRVIAAVPPWKPRIFWLQIGDKKQHKHKLFGPDFPRTFLTLAPECPGVNKSFSPSPGPQKNARFGADVHDFRCGRP